MQFRVDSCKYLRFRGVLLYNDSLTELYNTVAQAYNDSGAEDADIKVAMDEAYEYLTQMGEITQDSITEEDAQALAESMLTAIEVLSAIAENL